MHKMQDSLYHLHLKVTGTRGHKKTHAARTQPRLKLSTHETKHNVPNEPKTQHSNKEHYTQTGRTASQLERDQATQNCGWWSWYTARRWKMETVKSTAGKIESAACTKRHRFHSQIDSGNIHATSGLVHRLITRDKPFKTLLYESKKELGF